MTHRKPAFIALFTVLSLAGIVLVTISMSLASFFNFRTVAYNQIETELTENIVHLRETVSTRFSRWSSLLQRTAFGIAPFMADYPAEANAVEVILRRIKNTQRDLKTLFCSANVPWTEPEGYMIYSDGTRPPADMDNTARSWFRNAKSSPGQIIYSEPFISLTHGGFVIAVSTTVYGDNAEDIGVVAGLIDLEVVDSLLAMYATIPEQRIFLLNKEGYVITDPDGEGNLTTDFFAHSDTASYREQVLSSPSFSSAVGDHFLYSAVIPELNWILVSMVPSSVMFTSLNRVMVETIVINLTLVVIAIGISVILTRILQNERDENTAMKDNLNIGFFLLDRNYIIQGQYSHGLERILDTAGLKGKSFIDLLSGSLSEQECNTVKDYFDMILNRSFDQDLLDDVNPIQELSYRRNKTLRCGFTGVSRGRKDVVILGNIIDTTTEKQLKDRLAEEEAKRQEDMRFLFEVIQADPMVLQDFIEDMDYGFDRINAVLTDDDVPPKDASVSLYQEIHGIKSNAVILGLKTFGEKLHALESDIKAIRDQPSVLYEDLVRLHEGIRRIKQDRSKVMDAIRKIQSFKSNGKQYQGAYILLESLTKACEKVSADLDKPVKLVVEKLDFQTVADAPRRAIKDVLMQLIRNAVYHGIETRAERIALGKNEIGAIGLSITHDEDWIQIRLSDNGKGLDFAKIRAKAERLRLIPQTQEEPDREKLTQFIFAPGFSTADDIDVHAGRGIGLNLVKDRIRELGGTIKVRSEANKGTVFFIYIPIPAMAATQAS
ncbi:MAG: hypothetical protein LBG73_09525 [Spirochaetaceae bacterium]|jgi:two-component system chemotaxis sensor kinase CheA|nr:hypothetical protein [Spirochaetaceae bacterium]